MRFFPFQRLLLVPRFPPALIRGRLLSQMSSNCFFPFLYYKIQTNDRKGQVVGGRRGFSWLRAVGTVASSQRCYGGCRVASSFPQMGWRIRGLSNGTS